MNKTDILLDSAPFLYNKETSQLFIDSFVETANHHYKNNKYFKYLWDKKNLNPSDIKTEQDILSVPFILVNQFKAHDFKSSDKIVLTLGSSGTSGQRSVMHLDQNSLDNVKKLAYSIHESLGITSHKKYNYLCFTYDPAVANDLGTAFTDELLTNFTDKNEVYYTFQFDEVLNDFKMNEEEIVETLKRFEKSQFSTRILGFPAFLYDIIKRHNLKINLGPDSWVQTGGGWKSKADEEIPKAKFREFVSEHLGLPESNIRDLFGMVEHGIPYVDCHEGNLKIPNFSRVIIRDPYTLEPVLDGEIGLIQFICTYNTSYPAMSILTTDWGRKVKSEEQSDYSLEIIGRAGVNKNKGCALKALELMGE